MSDTERGGAALAEAVKKAYEAGQTDYYLEPMVRVRADGTPIGKVQDGDAVPPGRARNRADRRVYR